MNEDEQINTIGQETNNFNNYTQGTFNNKKKNNMLFIIPVIIVIAIIGVAVFAYMNYTKPEQFYKRLIASAIQSSEENPKTQDINTQKNIIKLDLDLDLETELEVDKEILDLINDTSIEIGTQIDKSQKELVVDLKADYDKDELLDLKLFANLEEEKAYLYGKEFVDKYIDLDLTSEAFTDVKDLFETEKMTLGQKINSKKGIKLLKEEFTEIIKSEYCSSEKATVKINDKEVKTTKNIVKMTLEQMADGLTTALNNLRKNQEFIDIFEEDYRDEVIEFLEGSIDEIEETVKGNEDGIIQLNIYTKGLTQKIVKVEIITIDEDESATIACTKMDEQRYVFELLSDDKKLIQGSFNVESKENNNGTIKIETEIEEVGEIEVNIEYMQENNISIDQVDEDKISTIEDFTQADQMQLMQNLQKSKLYELIEKFSKTSSNIGSSSNTNNFISSGSTSTNNTNEKDNDITSSGNSTSSLSNKNQIFDYNKEFKITFGVPNGYKSNSISENYHTLTKDDISVTITAEYNMDNEYYNTLNKSKEYLEKQGSYKNVTLSAPKTTTISGTTFYKSTLEYEYVYSSGSLKIVKDYIWAKLSDNKVVQFEISNLDKMTNAELEEILTINVEKQ